MKKLDNIFLNAPEFINLDSRHNRDLQRITFDSQYKRCLVHFPFNLVESKTVLDLGCAVGAGGHFALMSNCLKYTGVDIGDYNVTTAKELLGKYWSKEQFEIVQQDIEEFLDDAVSFGRQWDYVVASGVIYAFLDCVSILKKISKVSRDFILIESQSWSNKIFDDIKLDYGTVAVHSRQFITEHLDADNYKILIAPGSRISPRALEIVMETCSFTSSGILYPEPITGTPDFYRKIDNLDDDSQPPWRFIMRFQRSNQSLKTIQDYFKSSNQIEKSSWVFDDAVAERFQQEANTNIPSYELVLDKCLNFALEHIDKTEKIIDVGSALGYTLKKFHSAGYTNIVGVDNSSAMVAKSYRPDLIVLQDTLPIDQYKLVLANWSLHFVKDKIKYLQDIYDCLEKNGYFIISEKTQQSDIIKDMYYKFKVDQGISLEYIRTKEQQLKTSMFLNTAEWYLKTLRLINFRSVDIIHADLGFVTFLCIK